MKWRVLLALVLVALWIFPMPSVLRATPTIVDSDILADINTAPTARTRTLTGIQAGDAIVACGVVEGSQTISFSDDKSNTYTEVANVMHAAGYPRTRMVYALNVASGDTVVTMTLSTAYYRLFMVAAARGVATSGAAEDSDSAQGESTAPDTNAFTATSIGIAFSCLGTVADSAITEAAGWTQLVASEDGCCSIGHLMYRLTTASTAYNGQWTLSATKRWGAIGVALKEPSGISPCVVGGGIIFAGCPGEW